ncbi:hypothetical protein BGZ82_002661 [Podila clonocystis]|nr:hypothetical protein BGZ82_002661 [Podila clonocystis]
MLVPGLAYQNEVEDEKEEEEEFIGMPITPRQSLILQTTVLPMAKNKEWQANSVSHYLRNLPGKK